MTDGDWKPREHDHLVEPVFAAVREPGDEAEGGAARHRPARRLVLSALVVAALLAALLLWLVLSPGACASNPQHATDWKLAA